MKQFLLILAAGFLVAGLAASAAQASTRMVLMEEWTNTS
jgi:hypothetical protein